MKKFKKNASLLLCVLGMDSITSVFVYTFLLAYILNISSNGIVNVAYFYLVLHASMIVLSFVFAPIFKKINKTIPLKVGIFIKFGFVVLVALLGDKVIRYVYLIAILDAFAETIFGAGANALIPLATDNLSMQQFMSVNSIIGKVVAIVIPPLMGFWIDMSGMKILSVAMVAVVAIQVFIVVLIKEKAMEGGKIRYKEFISRVRETGNKNVKPIYTNTMLKGIISNLSMLVLYFTYVTFHTNVSIGIFATIAAVLTIVFLSIFSLKKSIFKKNISFLIYMVLLSASIVAIMFTLNKTTLILFYIAWSLCMAVPDAVSNAQRFEIVQAKELKEFNIENMTLSEVALDFGRVIGEATLLIMGIVDNRSLDLVVLGLAVVAVVAHMLKTMFLVRKIEDPLAKPSKRKIAKKEDAEV